MTATLDRVSNGRLLVNVVTGGEPVENKGDGIFLHHDERYAVTREFLNVYSDLLAGKTVNVEGKHIRLQDGRLLFPPVQSPRPPLYFRGSSDVATSSRSAQISGPVSAWCAAARERHWLAIPRPWPRGSGNIRTSASIPSSCRAIRISRKPTASPNWCFRCCRCSNRTM